MVASVAPSSPSRSTRTNLGRPAEKPLRHTEPRTTTPSPNPSRLSVRRVNCPLCETALPALAWAQLDEGVASATQIAIRSLAMPGPCLGACSHARPEPPHLGCYNRIAERSMLMRTPATNTSSAERSPLGHRTHCKSGCMVNEGSRRSEYVASTWSSELDMGVPRSI